MNFKPMYYLTSMSTLLYIIAVVANFLSSNSFMTTNAFNIIHQQPVVVVRQRQSTNIPSYIVGSCNNLIICSSSSSSNSEIEEAPSLKQQQITKKAPRPSPTGFSYVEEGVYTNIEEEIEAMGGDPSFLMEAPSTNDNTIPMDNVKTSSMESNASPIAWEWDGVEEDDAYFDE